MGASTKRYGALDPRNWVPNIGDGDDEGQFDTPAIRDGAITPDKLSDETLALGFTSLDAGYMLVGNTEDVPTPVEMSGDATMDDTGAVTIGALKISTGKIAALAVTLAKIGLPGTAIPVSVDISAATQVSTYRAVTIQAVDTADAPDAAVKVLPVWLSDAAAGPLCATAPSIINDPTVGEIITHSTGKTALIATTSAGGAYTFLLGHSSATTVYVNALTASGIISNSVAIT